MTTRVETVLGQGNDIIKVFGGVLASVPIAPGTVYVYNDSTLVGYDDALRVIKGTALSVGSVDYLTGALTVTFVTAPVTGNIIKASYIPVVAAKEQTVWSDLHPDLAVDANKNIKVLTNVQAVYAAIENIFLTVIGSRVMMRSFAGRFSQLLFEPLVDDVLRTHVLDEMKDVIEKWDNRVKISVLDVKHNSDRDTLFIYLEFYIRGYDKVFTLERQYRK